MKLYWIEGSGWFCGGAAVVVAADPAAACRLAHLSEENRDPLDNLEWLDFREDTAIELPGAAELGKPRVLAYYNIEAP